MSLTLSPAAIASVSFGVGPGDSETVTVVDWTFAIVMGLVEGITEFLPISSTGHLILTSSFFPGRDDTTFQIAIQMGAITAILVLYWRRLWDALGQMFGGGRSLGGTGGASDTGARRENLLWLILAAALPPAALGLLFDEPIDRLLFNETTVATTLILGGIVFLVLEHFHKHRTEDSYRPMEQMTIAQALLIGLFQSVALIPGTSRSGATMVGALVLGFRRTAAAEFSFLVGLPLLYGASLMKLWQHGLGNTPLDEFVIAIGASFVSALVVVRPFVRFLQNHSFVPFAWYRILVGAVVFLWLV
ncbi:MAG: undecaprenyl-diphosphate phosphatase [Planctomycetota bacterium]